MFASCPVQTLARISPSSFSVFESELFSSNPPYLRCALFSWGTVQGWAQGPGLITDLAWALHTPSSREVPARSNTGDLEGLAQSQHRSRRVRSLFFQKRDEGNPETCPTSHSSAKQVSGLEPCPPSLLASLPCLWLPHLLERCSLSYGDALGVRSL